jgi:hypothetical protein
MNQSAQSAAQGASHSFLLLKTLSFIFLSAGITSAPTFAIAAPPTEAQFKQAAGCSAECVVLNPTRLHLPESKAEAYAAKVRTSDGAILVVTLGGDGKVKLDKAKLLATEEDARRSRLGFLTQRLAKRLERVNATDNVPVAIWMNVPLDYPAKEDIISNSALRESFAIQVAQKVRAASKNVTDWLRSNGAKINEDGAYTPLIRAEVAKDKVRNIDKLPSIMMVDEDDPGRPATNAWYQASRIDLARGLTVAAGVRACSLETHRPASTTFLRVAGTASINSATSAHIQQTLGIMSNSRGNNTSVTDSTLTYAANWDQWPWGNNPPDAVAWCLNQGANIINHSMSMTDGTHGMIKANNDMQQDWYAKLWPYPIFIDAAGNTDSVTNAQYVEQIPYNTLVVGASNDYGNAVPATHTIASFSEWKNPTTAHNDRELPHVVAPGVNVDSADQSGLSGTSFAAPQVAGTVMLMHARDAGLITWPEGSRAIILATSIQSVDGSSLGINGIGLCGSCLGDSKDGVGALQANFATSLASPSNFKNPGTTSSQGHFEKTLNLATGGGDFDANNLGPTWTVSNSSGFVKQVRVAMAWNGTPTGCNSSGGGCTSEQLDGDLELEILQNGSAIASSLSWDSSWEAVDFALSSGQSATIRVRKASNNAQNTYFGIAWWMYSLGSI